MAVIDLKFKDVEAILPKITVGRGTRNDKHKERQEKPVSKNNTERLDNKT